MRGGRALQVAGLIGLIAGVVTCAASDLDSNSSPDQDGAAESGTGTTGSGPTSGDMGPTKSHVVQTEAGFGGSQGSGGGTGGAGGAPEDPLLDECALKGYDTLTAVLAVEDTNAYAAPAYAREILRSADGDIPAQDLIKPHEFFNYYALPYDLPAGDTPIGVTAGMREISPGSGEYRVYVGVTAPKPTARPRVNVAIVVDTSLSMTAASMLRAKAIAKGIGKSLREGDVVSLVTWNPEVPPILDAVVVSGPDDPVVTKAIDGLYVDGSSDLQAGLVRGYQLAKKQADVSSLNRVVYISDGRVTLGTWEEEIVKSHARGLGPEQPRVLLVGAATGPGPGYDEGMMAKMTAAGEGSYVYVDSEAEAGRLFHDRFDEVMGEPIYENVTLTFSVPGYFEISVPLVEDGSYTPDPTAVVGRPLAPGDSVTFNQIVRVCHPLVIKNDHMVDITIGWWERGNPVTQTSKTSLSLGEMLKTAHPGIQKAHAISLYIDALQSGDPMILLKSWTEIDIINGSFKPQADKPGDPELEEILGLIKRHPNYAPPAQP